MVRQKNYELYEVAQLVNYCVFNKLVQQIIPENGNFGLCAFSSSLTYQNVQICNVWLFSHTVAMET